MVNGAAPSIAIKAARLFIWLARQAGFETAEVEFTPYNMEQEKASRQKSIKKNSHNDRSGKRKNKDDETDIPNPADLRDYEEQLLNILLEKMRTTDALPSPEILQQVRELIQVQKLKNKSQHANNTAEPSVSMETSDA